MGQEQSYGNKNRKSREELVKDIGSRAAHEFLHVHNFSDPDPLFYTTAIKSADSYFLFLDSKSYNFFFLKKKGQNRKLESGEANGKVKCFGAL